MEVFIQGLLYRAAVVLEGTRFSTMLRTVSLESVYPELIYGRAWCIV